MNSIYCCICHDKTHAQQKLHELQNIRYRLERYVRDNHDTAMHNSDTTAINCAEIHLHFMCGHCLWFDNMKFTHEQNYIRHAVINIYYSICNGQISITEYNEILRLLSGNYPAMYHAIQRAWQKHVKEEEK